MSKAHVVTDFACKVTEVVTGVPYDLVVSSYVAAESPTGISEDRDEIVTAMKPYGFDPMTILAIITAIIQVMDLLKNGCNKPEAFAENARIRNPLMLAVFKARVFIAAKQAGYPRKPAGLANAMLDVAHSTGSTMVAAVVNELDMI